MEEKWLSNLAVKAMRICRLNKKAAGNHRQDMTGPVLQNLLRDGYTQVMWNSNGSHHGQCRDLNKQVWDLQDFLRTTEYDAPLFSRAHPGDSSCTLTVSGAGLPDVEVDSYGETDAAIGINRPPAPAPAPRPQVRPMAPAPKPKVERVPEKPETKIRHVSPEVHKQIKDPFEKRDLTPEEYEQWLSDLERENVEESIPARPTDEDVEDWQRDLERETSLKPKNWIRGLFR